MISKDLKNILWLKDINQSDGRLVGGKNAALGEMYNALDQWGVRIPNAFAVTSTAYYSFLEQSGIKKIIEELFTGIDLKNLKQLRRSASKARRLILKTPWPKDLEKDILTSYKILSGEFGQKNTDVAVRASVAAVQTAISSFPGQQETFLGINKERSLLWAIKKCFASLFNDHAIIYRAEKNLSLFDIALAVGVQKMVRSDLGASGVAITVDPDSGYEKVMVISSAYGLGELIVDGKTDPDEFCVFKPGLTKGCKSIIKRQLGQKKIKGVYGRKGVKPMNVSNSDRGKFSINDQEVILLAQWCAAIEDHYSRMNNRYVPQEIEWAKDGQTGRMFIVQASPESVHRGKRSHVYRIYNLKTEQKPILAGIAVGREIVTGPAKVIHNFKDLAEVKKGDILVTQMTDFKWVSVINEAVAIVADHGSRTCHAAIISREYNVPAVINTGQATQVLHSGQIITVDNSQGSEGRVYNGRIPFSILEQDINQLPSVTPKISINISKTDDVFHLASLPVNGVGLVREEFVIMNEIGIHPKALCQFDQIESVHLKDKIAKMTTGYADKKEYFIDKLSQSVGTIAAAFWPRQVLVRFSDLKTSEYRQLIGGELFEPEEANPMIGWRGASRYYHPDFRSVFELECQSIKRVREDWGLTNVAVMVPFCRTPGEGQKVLTTMSEFGLKKGADHLLVYMMAELPSNIVLADHFLDIFDGFSIGSNDLMQLVLGIDRDNAFIQDIGDERNLAMKHMIKEAIEWAHAMKKPIGLCGEGPVNFPDLALFLAEHHIDSISVAPNAVIPMIMLLSKNGFIEHHSI